MYHVRCIRGVLKDKLVVLVTHQLQFAEKADKILAIKEVCFYILDMINSCMQLVWSPWRLVIIAWPCKVYSFRVRINVPYRMFIGHQKIFLSVVSGIITYHQNCRC